MKNKTKTNTQSRLKSVIGNRTIIGIICIVMALAICFGVAPLVNRFTDRKANVVRVKTDIVKGQVITADDIEIATVGSYNLPTGAITDAKAVVGKTASADLSVGDFVFITKLSDGKKTTEDILRELDGTKVAISVTVDGLASEVSGKISGGDIVSAIIYNTDIKMSYIPPELKYLYVITTTDNTGIDRDKSSESAQSSTITFFATPEQAELLAQYDKVTSIHFVLVCHDNETRAAEYVRVQDEYLNRIGGGAHE
ncbi:MAG: pilus assembly protein CpaB [Clostridia bacterium]|nr:pilus assembly protein CpaB [Clostridia bacterium]